MKNHDPKFSELGVGLVMSASFNNYLEANKSYFPFGLRPRGTLMVLSDYGGQHKGSQFETFSFLIFDLEANRAWLEGQKQFRQQLIKDGRRIAFKSLNDRVRRRSLIPFLSLADTIDGWLVTYSVSKDIGQIFENPPDSLEHVELLKLWKRRPSEKLKLILHLSAFLVSGLSIPYQNILWICDQDDIAANTQQLTQLTKLFGNIYSNYEGHHLQHLRFGTTESDDGTRSLEDLVSICDLSAGAFAEIVSGMKRQGLFPGKKLYTGLPQGLTDKTRLLATWLSYDRSTLRRLNCILDKGKNGLPRMTMIKTHAFVKKW